MLDAFNAEKDTITAYKKYDEIYTRQGADVRNASICCYTIIHNNIPVFSGEYLKTRF